MFFETLTSAVGCGEGECSIQDLFEIWPIRPDSDRHMRALYWYEPNTDDGIEYLVIHVVATLDFKTDQRWWIRLERNGGQLEKTT